MSSLGILGSDSIFGTGYEETLRNFLKLFQKELDFGAQKFDVKINFKFYQTGFSIIMLPWPRGSDFCFIHGFGSR